MAAAAILDVLNLHFRIPLVLITHEMKYIFAKFRENLINSNEMSA
jgi:ABC-type methionine transport system ATPase subunit